MYKGRRERLSGLPNFVPRAFCLYGGKWSWHHPVTRHPEFSLGCFDMANQIIESSAISQSDYRIVRSMPWIRSCCTTLFHPRHLILTFAS